MSAAIPQWEVHTPIMEGRENLKSIAWCPATVVCATPHEEDIARVVGYDMVHAVDAFLDCHVLNSAMTKECTKDGSEFIVLLHPYVTGLFQKRGADAVRLSFDEVGVLTSRIIQLMDCYGANVGGVAFPGMWVAGKQEVHPFSLIHAVCPGYVILRRSEFRGFEDMPYVDALYDYQLRELHENTPVIRENGYATDLRPDFLAVDMQLERWGKKALKEMYVGKLKSRYYEFTTKLPGV